MSSQISTNEEVVLESPYAILDLLEQQLVENEKLLIENYDLKKENQQLKAQLENKKKTVK